MHKVRQNLASLEVGSVVVVDGIDFECTLLEVRGRQLRVTYDWWFDPEWEAERREVEVSYTAYKWTLFRSPDNLEKDPQADWSSIEQHYGISHLGSQDTDPVRQLALSVLRETPHGV